MKWICCQIGAREHYAVPRALQLGGLLDEVITDLWVRPGTLIGSGRTGLTGRFHPGLASARVLAPNAAALKFELKAYATGANGWSQISRRNQWFQQYALDLLHKEPINGPRTVFAYSYAAEEIFKFARERGWRTVLGQIDPGPAEERLVASLHESDSDWEPAPAEYWDRWHAECELADQIVVNSDWSKSALLGEGIRAEKIRVVPVAYETSPEAASFQRPYPNAFTAARPLRVLFLGQIALRKGVRQLLDAVELLAGENIEFWFVGPAQISLSANVKWFGVVPRIDVDKYYKEADVFILPTLSDGFGLTQLEAQSWKLPVIASRHCGNVVSDEVNGVIVKEVSGPAIANVLRRFLHSPEILSAMSGQSGVSERFSLRNLAASLASLG
jgi:glycosyltransferase involved in cell wall biosynthesis